MGGFQLKGACCGGVLESAKNTKQKILNVVLAKDRDAQAEGGNASNKRVNRNKRSSADASEASDASAMGKPTAFQIGDMPKGQSLAANTSVKPRKPAARKPAAQRKPAARAQSNIKPATIKVATNNAKKPWQQPAEFKPYPQAQPVLFPYFSTHGPTTVPGAANTALDNTADINTALTMAAHETVSVESQASQAAQDIQDNTDYPLPLPRPTAVQTSHIFTNANEGRAAAKAAKKLRLRQDAIAKDAATNHQTHMNTVAWQQAFTDLSESTDAQFKDVRAKLATHGNQLAAHGSKLESLATAVQALQAAQAAQQNEQATV